MAKLPNNALEQLGALLGNINTLAQNAGGTEADRRPGVMRAIQACWV